MTENVLQEDKSLIEKKKGAEAFGKLALPALAFSVLWIACLYRNPAGILYPVFMAGTLWLLRYTAAKTGHSPEDARSRRIRAFYEVSMLLISVQMCTTASGVLHDLDFLACVLLGISYVNRIWQTAENKSLAGRLGEIALTFVYPLIRLPEPVMDALSFRQEKGRDKNENSSSQAVVRGLLIAAPFLFVVILLLRSADLVFGRLIDGMLDIFSLPDYSEYIIEIVLQTIFTFVSFYTICKALSEKEAVSEKEHVPGGNPVTGITVLTLVAAVYLIFCAIQLIYLFGHAELPEGVSYAQYAHEGFYQLVFVCILNLSLVSVTRYVFKDNRILRLLLVIICCCTYVMIASCATRMILYVNVYRLTFLRLFVLWFLVVLALVLTWLLIEAAGRKFPVFTASAVTVTVLYLIFGFSHPDYWIARYNMSPARSASAVEYREETGSGPDRYDRYLDKVYLATNLSDDAVPAIAKDPELMQMRIEHQNQSDIPQDKNMLQKVRTFNFSEYAAQKYYDQYR